MGLSIALSNALSGMRAGQNGLDVISRNVANAGVPGYHRQSVNVVDGQGASSSYVRTGAVSRAFNQSLSLHYSRALSETGFSSARATYLDRLQMAIGKPGGAGTLDTAFNSFQAAMSQLAASPDNYAVRADAVAKAQVLAGTLNDLSRQVQTLRQETESAIGTRVDDLNRMLSSLEQVNDRLGDQSMDPAARASLLDQRDRLVADISSMVDVRVTYRNDDTVALMTNTGVGLLDGRASVFEFQSGGPLSANSLFNTDTSQSGVGTLTLRTPAGLALNVVQQNVLRSGELAGLIELRDKTLVQAQDQLDEVAAALAQSMSTVETAGTAASSLPATGLAIDIAGIRNGNDFVLNYTQGGTERSVRVIRVDDTTKLPMDVTDAEGNRVIGLDFSGGATSVASQLQALLGPGLAISNPSGSQLQILDDGAGNTTDVTGLTSRTTVTANQGAGLALSLFVDSNNADFTNALDGGGQKRGFAARIAVNDAIVGDMQLMVQFTANGSLGDDDRADYLLDRLENMRFASYDPSGRPASFRHAGSVGDFITQTINHQGNVVANALADTETQALTMEAIEMRMDSEYGVDIDEEMARLMELQNAYAANARVLAAIQALIEQLMGI